jgi:S-adenosylmethionine:tRNA ribosyltransferase-isomerase
MTTQSSLSPDLLLSQYDYHLPLQRIAQFPLAERDQSRMMVLNRQAKTIAHHHFYDLPDFLDPGDLVVVNNTKVLQARLLGHRVGYTGKVELLLLFPDQVDPTIWTTLMKPTRKLPPGTMIGFQNTSAIAEILGVDERVQGRVRFHLNGEDSVMAVMDKIGEIPIPPYLNREVVDEDKSTYQTVYAKDSEALPGSKAAPTAGLHFTPRVLKQLEDKGIRRAEVTLSVSTGTFRNVATEDITQHKMDLEWYTLDEPTARLIEETKRKGNRVIGIGTTSVKTLESVAYKHQGQLVAETAASDLFIYPGFQFQVVDRMLTNFHLPKTTLMMMISAFSDREFVLNAYEEAVLKEYRFFSYGDCMLII